MSPQAVPTPFWYAMQPRCGSPAEFRAARELLVREGFDYGSVCGRLGAEHLYLLSTTLETAYLARPIADGLDVLIRLLIIGRALDEPGIRQWLGAEGLECLAALQLLAPQPGTAESWFSPVMLYPVPGGVMVSDRNATPDGVKLNRAPADALYPALFQNTLDFVARFPESPCERILEIGTGTGAAAIQWAGLAKKVWATDITPRAVHFAEFNRRLADVGNMTVVEGDLYEPVREMTFDRIACHPPYVPVKDTALIFRDGGEDGEQIARRIVEGLPRFLRPGGLFWASFMISDRIGELAERRIRKWLGESAGEFDLGLAVDGRRTAAETIAHAVLKGNWLPEDVAYAGDLWRENQTEFLVHASVLIRRHGGGREAVTARMQAGTGSAARHLEWLLDWELAQRRPGFVENLLESSPVLAPACVLTATHRLENAAVASEQFTLEADGPIRGACRCPSWLVRMLMKCDGGKTARRHFQALIDSGEIPAGSDPREFAGMLAGLVAAAVLRVDIHPLPAAQPA